MNDSPFISRLVYRLFLLSWMFAVLWVKEYYWWTFSIAAILLLVHDIILSVAAFSRTLESDSTASTSHPRPPSGGGVDEGEPDIWREPKPPRSSRSRKT